MKAPRREAGSASLATRINNALTLSSPCAAARRTTHSAIGPRSSTSSAARRASRLSAKVGGAGRGAGFGLVIGGGASGALGTAAATPAGACDSMRIAGADSACGTARSAASVNAVRISSALA